MNFRTKILPADVNIYGISNHIPALKDLAGGGDYDIDHPEFIVHWDCELELREWGIKGISVTVADIRGTFEVPRFDKNGVDGDTDLITFDFTPFRANTAVEVEFDDWQSLQVVALDIDYSAHTVIIRS